MSRINGYELLAKQGLENNKIDFYYNPKDSLIEQEAVEMIMREAAEYMSEFTPISFNYKGITDVPLSLAADGQNDQITIGWQERGRDILAFTKLWASEWITDSEIAFDLTYEGWQPEQPNRHVMFQRVLIHELLHATGIGHTWVNNSLLNRNGVELGDPHPMYITAPDMMIMDYQHGGNTQKLNTRPVVWSFTKENDLRLNQEGDRSIILPVVKVDGEKKFRYGRFDQSRKTVYNGKFVNLYQLTHWGYLDDEFEDIDKLSFLTVTKANKEEIALKDVWSNNKKVPTQGKLERYDNRNWALIL